MDRVVVVNVSIVVIALAFTYAGVVATRAWRSGRARSLRWIAAAMFAMATAWLSFRVFQFETSQVNRDPVWTIAFLGMTIAPWCLLRFAVELAGGHRRTRIAGDAILSASVLLQLVIHDRIAPGMVEPTAPQAIVHASIMLTSTFATAASAIILWRVARRGPSTVRNRLRLLAIAFVALYLSLLAAGIREYPLLLAFAALLVGSILLLVAGAMPPRWLRDAWSAPLLRRLLRELAEVSAMTDPEAVRARLLPTIARAASAERAVMHDVASGRAVEEWGPEPAGDARRVRLPSGDVELELVGAPHDPFFGIDEHQLVRDLGLHLEVALQRCQLLDRERRAATRIAEANERLVDANAELYELAELRDGFVAIASHELRTPITTIMGFTRTLIDLWSDIDDGERLRYLTLVDRDARRLAQLVGDLLLLSSVESPDFRVARDRVDVRRLLEQVCVDVGGEAEAVELHVAEGLAVHADPRHVRQVFVNLVANAVRHGAAPIRVRARHVGEFGDKVQVEVTDAGPGIPLEFRERLFGRFARAEASAAVPGSGLGLFIVRRLVEVQGGRVWLQDGAVGTGASFAVELPAAAATAASTPAP